MRRHAAALPFIELVSLPKTARHDFASKVNALNQGAKQLQGRQYDFIGHLDADVSFGPTYFATLLERFDRDPRLGIGGGDIREWDGKQYSPRSGNSVWSVPGAVQMFRRECYEAVGGFLPLRYGGEDWCAEVTARRNGWRVQSFPELPVHHHGAGAGSYGVGLRRWFQGGLMDYSVGSHPLFEMARLARRLRSQPYVLGACARWCGYVWAACRREKRIVSKEFVQFLRAEEMARLRTFAIFHGPHPGPAGGPRVAATPLRGERYKA